MSENLKPDLILKLADVLEQDAEAKEGIRFDFCDWGYTTSPEAPKSCGTTGCAMAVAAISGAFAEQGLGYRFHDCSVEFTLNGKPSGGTYAASQVFGLTEGDAQYLFTDEVDLYVTREAEGEREVAHRLRKFVELNGDRYAVQDYMSNRKREKMGFGHPLRVHFQQHR